jgi:hypothetical protein
VARRIRRTILVLSLVLCVASIALWVRSQYRHDAIVTRWPAHGMAIRSGDGIVRVYLRNTDRVGTVNTNAWQISSGSGWFSIDDDPFQADSSGWSSLTFQPTTMFEWERVQGAAPSRGVQLSLSGSSIVFSAPAGARPTVGDDYLRITFPHWLPVLVFGFLPALAALRFMTTHWRRYRRLLAGACPVCAYDLRATPGRCPECGWTVSAPREAGKRLPQTPAPSPDAAPG